MGFVILGVVLGTLLISAAVVDWHTRRSGRTPRSPAEMRALIRDGRRETWRARFRGTKLEALFPDYKEGPDVYGNRRSGASEQRPYGTPPGVYDSRSAPGRRGRRR